MRLIKFRAWYKNNEEMCEVIHYNSPSETLVILCKSTSTIYMDSTQPIVSKMLPFRKVELMQYTGLKDKNGKEIYEGDILHQDAFWDIYIVWDDKHSRFAYLCTDWVVTQGDPISILSDQLSKFEVIGNIYENPELLK